MLNPNTPEWLLERMGKFTGSQCHRLMAYPDKNSLAKGAETYVKECVAEELSGERAGFDGNANTEHGHTFEPAALTMYGIETGIIPGPGRLVLIDEHSGCTPDGMNGGEFSEDSRLITPCDFIQEVKCPPKPYKHLDYYMMQTGADLESTEKQYWYQCHFNMMGTGAKWCDFITYHPYYEGELRFKTVRVERSDEVAGQIKNKLKLAVAMKQEMLDTLLRRNQRATA